MLYLVSDHRGFKLKEKIKKYLDKNKIIFTDLGALKYDKDDDYPDFAKILALKILENKNNLGIALCGSCLLYTSDAADDLLCVDLCGRLIIKKKFVIVYSLTSS